MSSNTSILPPDPETLTRLEEWLIKSVAEVMKQRGTAGDFYEALVLVALSSPEDLGETTRRLDAAAHRMRDDAVRIVVELSSTAAVMQSLGEFPTPDEGRTD